MKVENRGVLSVSEFNELINVYLSTMGEVNVKGEISQFRISQNKWIFLTIKDNAATVEVFGTIYNISNHRELEEGMVVQIIGTPRLYQKSGRFSIFANQISPSGTGALALAFEKLKQRLEKEGLFDPNRKRQLPEFPERIGLITAKGSRAYSDFAKILLERMGGLKIYFYPVSVQGADSTQSIIRAFTYFNQNNLNLDLLVLTRGGGNLEDLVSFNDEAVVRAVFTSKIPVVCAVGHEEDISLSDLAADLRASTPSNAAELIVRQRPELLTHIQSQARLIELGLNDIISESKRRVFQSISQLKNHVDQYLFRMQKHIVNFTNQYANFKHKLVLKSQQLETLIRILQNLDYRNLLAKGYSIAYTKDKKILRSKSQLKSNENMYTIVADGKIHSTVIKIE